MKISRGMLALVAALFLSMPAWAQTSNAPSTSATAAASGQEGESTSTNAQENTPRTKSGENTEGTPRSDQSSSGIANSSAATTLHGCVTGGADTYVLISDADGAAYTLVGRGPDLDNQINHEVEVTGTRISAPPSSQPSSHESETGAPAHASGSNFQVTSVRQISDHCPSPRSGR